MAAPDEQTVAWIITPIVIATLITIASDGPVDQSIVSWAVWLVLMGVLGVVVTGVIALGAVALAVTCALIGIAARHVASIYMGDEFKEFK